MYYMNSSCMLFVGGLMVAIAGAVLATFRVVRNVMVSKGLSWHAKGSPGHLVMAVLRVVLSIPRVVLATPKEVLTTPLVPH